MEFFAGVCHPRERLDLMKEAGVQWLRADAPFPFEKETGNPSKSFKNYAEKISQWSKAGFKVMGITPYPRGWKLEAGKPGSQDFLEIYEEACRYLASELKDTVQGWQISNELNLEMFRRPLTEAQAIEYAKYGGSGVKKGSPSALVGVNMAGFSDSALRMYAKLYPEDDKKEQVEFNYVGTDGYFGSWSSGGPDSWHEKLKILYEKIRKPIIIQEFGYASAGEVMTPEERNSGKSPHELKKWAYDWRDGHTPEVQAEYLGETYKIFKETPTVLGAIWYCWADQDRCWNCGAVDCPCETAWGLVDIDENPKPAYYVYKHILG
ncbi:hypothetical protein GF312_04315 [Candidatus Poribacteria bacterium]|nr:hypothetical protein [Candidatus Poribacteria bacterium]